MPASLGAARLLRRVRLPLDPIWYKIGSTTGAKPGNGRKMAQHLEMGGCRMNQKQVLFSTVAAIGILTLASSVPAPLSAQPKPPQGVATAIAIDADDIGGTVRG